MIVFDKLKVKSIKYLILPVVSLGLDLVLDLDTDKGSRVTTLRIPHLLNVVEQRPLDEQIRDAMNDQVIFTGVVPITQSTGLS